MKSTNRTPHLLFAACAVALLSISTAKIRAQQPAPPITGAFGAAGTPRPAAVINGVQNQTPSPDDVVAMEDALPKKPIAAPRRPRKILVFCEAAGFVHRSIPLAAVTIKELGEKTGAWTAAISYDPSVFTAENLKQYDAIFLDSNTGSFLDDPSDPQLTAARRKAFIAFVRSGKGLAAIHAGATDSYRADDHNDRNSPDAAKTRTAAPSSFPPMGAENPTSAWPDLTKAAGALFKWHWSYPQMVTLKIDDPKSPLTAMFHGEEFDIHDEVYTFAQDSFSRKDIHVLTSIDYAKMSDADKAKEPAATKRTDGDYPLSWIRREGKGRVFIEALGHDEHFYFMPAMLQHLLAGTQYALGDLPTDDSPSAK
jgi:uncharacterized protein